MGESATVNFGTFRSTVVCQLLLSTLIPIAIASIASRWFYGIIVVVVLGTVVAVAIALPVVCII